MIKKRYIVQKVLRSIGQVLVVIFNNTGQLHILTEWDK